MQKYRPDIDGLRAVAVIPVVLFHAGFSLFQGGFVGVDVFFVISGYLITSIIMSDMAEGRFSVARFYERRIRRIFPALFTVVIFCVLVGWFILTPEDLKRLGDSVIATCLFSSNILFFYQTGYFDAPAMEKPLLHTWSLAVEEQFYLVFPLYLLLLSKYFSGHMRKVTIAVFGASLVLNVVHVSAHPVSTFYLPPTRAWELLLGVLLALSTDLPSYSRTVREAGTIGGLLLIAAPVFVYSSATPFPGIAALAPTAGAALVIWTGSGTVGRFILANRPMVYIGRISYSLYLWHFPLVAFSNYLTIQGVGQAAIYVRIAIVAASFGLAGLSYRFVEQPFRRAPKIFSTRDILAGGFAGIAALTIVGLVIHVHDGMPSRLSPEMARLVAAQKDRGHFSGCFQLPVATIRTGAWCKLGAAGSNAVPTFALWGDSHAPMIAAVIDELARRHGQTGLLAAAIMCPPLPHISRVPDRGVQCDGYDAQLDFVVHDPSIETVILAGRWALWATGVGSSPEHPDQSYLRDDKTVVLSAEENKEVFRRGMEEVVRELVAAHKRVWIIGPVPEAKTDVPRALFILSRGLSEPVDIRPTVQDFKARQAVVLSELRALESVPGVSVIYPDKKLCDRERCAVELNGETLYRDDNHLSKRGLYYIEPIFDPIFK